MDVIVAFVIILLFAFSAVWLYKFIVVTFIVEMTSRPKTSIRIKKLDKQARTCFECEAREVRRTGYIWDRIGDRAYCPDCQENVAAGGGTMVSNKPEPRPCVICGQIGVVQYTTHSPKTSLEIDLCGRHLRELIGRRLPRASFKALRQQLKIVKLRTDHVFLLHDAFYDEKGEALCPINY